MKLSIIILNFNTLGDTLDCLRSLKRSIIPQGLSLQTIVIDNASSDGIEDILPQKFPEVQFIQSAKNLGFAGGNNLGITHALAHNRPTHLLLLNNDTIVKKDFLRDLFSSAINDRQVGIVTPLIYFAKGYEFHKNRYKKRDLGKVIWSAGGTLDQANVLGSNAHVDEVDRGQFTHSRETDFATGACMLIRRQVIDQIGLFNDRYFLYLEDLEFSWRAKQKGWRIVFDPHPRLWHKVSQSSAVGSSLNDYFITRNRLLFGLMYLRLRTKLALLRQAASFLFTGTPAQKTAVTDWLLCRLGKGTFIK